jgi:2-oxoglutarate ferredoxin oxidoreductase subunit alpha
MKQTFTIGIGGAAGQGVATPGDIFAKIFSRRGLHLNAYNAYQSIIRGGHTFLTIRSGPERVTNMGDSIDLLIPLNQDSIDRHLGLLTEGAACVYNADSIKPGAAAEADVDPSTDAALPSPAIRWLRTRSQSGLR